MVEAILYIFYVEKISKKVRLHFRYLILQTATLSSLFSKYKGRSNYLYVKANAVKMWRQIKTGQNLRVDKSRSKYEARSKHEGRLEQIKTWKLIRM